MKSDLTKLKELIGSNLTLLRKRKGWSIKEASCNLGVRLERLVLMEQGYSIKSVSNLYKIAKGYGVEISELFK